MFNVGATVDSGAYNSLFTVASPDFTAEMNGKYFIPVAKISPPSKWAENAELAQKLWEWTEKEMRSKGLLE